MDDQANFSVKDQVSEDEWKARCDLAALYRDAERLRPGDTFLHIDGNQTVDEVELAIREALAPIM